MKWMTWLFVPAHTGIHSHLLKVCRLVKKGRMEKEWWMEVHLQKTLDSRITTYSLDLQILPLIVLCGLHAFIQRLLVLYL